MVSMIKVRGFLSGRLIDGLVGSFVDALAESRVDF